MTADERKPLVPETIPARRSHRDFHHLLKSPTEKKVRRLPKSPLTALDRFDHRHGHRISAHTTSPPYISAEDRLAIQAAIQSMEQPATPSVCAIIELTGDSGRRECGQIGRILDRVLSVEGLCSWDATGVGTVIQ
jgi:hypothetical protein